MQKLTYIEFTKLAVLNESFNRQIISFKVNPAKVIESTFNKELGSCNNISEMKSKDPKLNAWLVEYKKGRPRYILITDKLDNIIVTDETSLDITDPDSIISE